MHKYLFPLYISVLLLLVNPGSAQINYLDLHSEALVADLHCDVLLQVLRGADISERLDFGQVDLVRLKEGGVDVQFFAVWPDPRKYKPHRMYQHTMHMIDLLEKILQENPQIVALAHTPGRIKEIVDKGKIAACIGVEGGTAIENKIENLQNLYDRGVRYLGLTWNDSPDWASSARDENSNTYQGPLGLTDFGKEVIRKMDELGMMIDVSHCGEQTFWDVIENSSKPVIASHSCAYKLRWHYRNLKDEQIRAIARNGGVIFINFYPGYLDYNFGNKYDQIKENSKAHLDSIAMIYGQDHFGYHKFRARYYNEQTEGFRPGIDRIVDHMDYIIKIAGDDNVGLGSDFDGISITPIGLDDVSQMSQITKCMIKRGYSESRIKKILGGNFMRVFSEITMNSKPNHP